VSTSTIDAAPRFRFPRFARALRRASVLAVAVALVYLAARALLTIYTNELWFHSVADGFVYSRTLLTELVLYLIFGGLTAVVLVVNLLVALRVRTSFVPDEATQRWRWRYHRYLHRRRGWLVALVALWLTLSVGSRASSGWQTWLAWRHATSFHAKDPQFHRDYSYFLFIYPLHRMVLSLLIRIVILAIVAVLITGYLYGGVRLRGRGPRLSRPVLAQTSALLGVLLILKAFAYWLDRFALATSNRGVVTGPSYTDIHVGIPGKTVLMIIAAVLALLFFANAYLRSMRLLILGIGAMAVAAFILGVAVPSLVQQFRAKPSAATLELPYIERNIGATQAAFGLDGDVTAQSYSGVQDASNTAVRSEADTAAQYRLLDPNRLSPTFTQLQQLDRSFYGFTSTLDVDHSEINGVQHDVVLALRELSLSGLPSSQKTWANRHLVYTHGYGVVAAESDKSSNGRPDFINTSSPSAGALQVTQPQVYYGQLSPSYSIVGAAPGAKPIEFDHPSTTGTGQDASTYQGGGGISLGSVWRRLVYALKFRSTSILFSKDVNSHSQLLTKINPRARVAAVAPWLTLDGDVYPTVINGKILWVVDGYTTSNNYPYSQQQNLRRDTTDTYTSSGSTVTQPSTSINYIRNSVKATVDAYTGQVTLYAWNQQAQPDPVLETWEKAFPGLVQPQSSIPAALLPHLRYPQDLFNIQRTVLTRYHSSDAEQYYNGSNFWTVPADPTVSATTSTNALGKTVSNGAPSQPSTYMTLSPDGGTSPAVYSLSSPLVSLSGRNLAAFLSVDSEPGPDYGHFTLLELPSGGSSVEGPSQVQSDIESDPNVASSLTLLRSGRSKVLLGNLLTVPLAGKILYVEPIYEQAIGASTSSYPILRKVIADYNTISYETQLSDALSVAIEGTSSKSSTSALQDAVTAAQQAQAAISADVTAGNLTQYAKDAQTLKAALATIAANSGSG
jgi:uncharacterized membrane protein (UPF0182 family)